MKSYIYLPLFFILLFTRVETHESIVHEYITKESVKIIPLNRLEPSFLNTIVNCSIVEDYPPTKCSFILSDEQIDAEGIGDPIYGYSCKTLGSKCFLFGLEFAFPIITSTHFFKQDDAFPYGENVDVLIKINSYTPFGSICSDQIKVGVFDNAFTKAKHYWYGDKNVLNWSNTDIITFYNIANKTSPWGSIWRLGRILHLLQDMSVPAHTHNDLHGGYYPLSGPPYFITADIDAGGDDEYETFWIGDGIILPFFQRTGMNNYKDYNYFMTEGLWHVNALGYYLPKYEYEVWTEIISQEDYESGNFTLDCGENCICTIKLIPKHFNTPLPGKPIPPLPVEFQIVKQCTRKIYLGDIYFSVEPYPMAVIFTLMNQMADYFPSDNYRGNKEYFDNSIWDWDELAINDIKYSTIYDIDGDIYKESGVRRISDALMPRVIEAGATLLYYFAQETWERFGEDGIHFIDAGGTDRGNKVIWFSNLGGPGQIVDIALSSYQVTIGAIGPVANKVDFYLDGTFLRSSPISEYKDTGGYHYASIDPSSMTPGSHTMEIRMMDIWGEEFLEQRQSVNFTIGTLPGGSFTALTVSAGGTDYLCDPQENIPLTYSIEGNQTEYLMYLRVKAGSGATVKEILSGETVTNGEHTAQWDFTYADPAFDTDGDGKADPGRYAVYAELKTLTGQTLNSKTAPLAVKSGEYFLPGDRTVDTGIRVDIGGTYSKGSIDQVDSPFILKLRNGTYRLYYEAGTDGSGYQGWYRRIMTGYSEDGYYFKKPLTNRLNLLRIIIKEALC